MKMQCNQLRSLCQYCLFKPRSASEREFLKNSIRQNGVLVPVITDETLAILKGHQRYDVCVELGINDIPVEIVHGLDEDQKRDLILQLGSNQRSLTTRDRKELAKNELKHRMGNISDNALGNLVGLSDKTVKGVRDKMIATSEIPMLTIRQGKDGVNRPARKPKITLVSSPTEASEILKALGDTLTEERNRDHRNQRDIWERETIRAEAEAEALKKGMSQKPQKPVAPCQNSLETLDDIDRSLAVVTIDGIILKAPQRIALARTLNAIIKNAQKLLDTLNGNAAETKNLTLTGDER